MTSERCPVCRSNAAKGKACECKEGEIGVPMTTPKPKGFLVRPFVSECLPAAADTPSGPGSVPSTLLPCPYTDVGGTVTFPEFDASASDLISDMDIAFDWDLPEAGTGSAVASAPGGVSSSPPLHEAMRHRLGLPRRWRLGPAVMVSLLLLASGAAALQAGERAMDDHSGGAGDTEEIDRTPPVEPELPDPVSSFALAVDGDVHGKAIRAPLPPKPKPPADRITYQGWVGPGCPETRGGYREFGDRWEWDDHDYGGYTGAGCNGSFRSVPMSEHHWGDGRSSAMWWWSVGADSRRCSLSVYVADSGDDRDAAGSPTHYRLLADHDDRSSEYARFEVDQADNHGRLVDVGTFEVRGGSIAVQMLSRGPDHDGSWGDYGFHDSYQGYSSYTGYSYHHRYDSDQYHAAAQIRATCRAA